MSRARATPLVVLALGTALAVAAAGFASRTPRDATALELAIQPASTVDSTAQARELPAPLAKPAVGARSCSPNPSSDAPIDAATAIDALGQALRQGEFDPATWSTMVAAHAADLDAREVAKLASRAGDAGSELCARLAALELMRACGARESPAVDAEFEARLERVAFGPDAQGSSSFAAAATLAAFGGAQVRERILERLEAGVDPRQTSRCLHGLREGADAAALEQIAARIQGCEPGEPQRRLAAAAQGLAPRLAREARGKLLAAGGRALIEVGSDPQLDTLARRRLLHSAAALGEDNSQQALCELALDPRIDLGLALEAATALRASPNPELTALLETYRNDPRIDPARLRELGATCDARRGGALAR